MSAYDEGFAAGILEAVTAINNTPLTWHRGMYGAPDDMYARVVIARKLDQLLAQAAEAVSNA